MNNGMRTVEYFLEYEEFEDYKKHNKNLRKLLLKKEKEMKSNPNTKYGRVGDHAYGKDGNDNKWISNSTTNMINYSPLLWKHESIMWLRKKIYEFVKKYDTHITEDYSISSWLNITRGDNRVPWHLHCYTKKTNGYCEESFICSGTYYVDCEKSFTEIEDLSLSIPAKNGSCVIFNGLYRHQGGHKLDGSVRISLAFDVADKYFIQKDNNNIWIPFKDLKNIT